jgi:peptidoglycan/LPS O-acetylase OafA/YrhL
MTLPILNPQMSPSLRYLPVFVVGMWLAFERDAIGAWAARRFAGARRMVWSLGALVVLPVLLSAAWIIRPSDLAHSQRFLRLASLVNWTALVAGAAALLVVSVHQPRWRALLERRVPQWIGLRSYGLYLVHEPVLVALAFLTATSGGHTLLFMVAAVALALVATAVFWRAVERPSLALARRAGRWGRAFDREPTPAPRD